MPIPFERSVFINCPFDDEYAAILQAIAFCVIYFGFYPRLAPENPDNAAVRLDRIIELIGGSKFGIHDLSRCKSTAADQYARMNMPFELGIDHGFRRAGAGRLKEKVILVLESTRYDYQKALSDIAGWDIQPHGGEFEEAVRHVRDWLVGKAGADRIGTSRILGKYIAFQEWHYERELASGASDNDIKKYPTNLILTAMQEWMDVGQPDSFA
ncbi:MAG TPA: hypothetical protein VGW34_04020 [Allosphingosinicella sp.]|nr:hypothetical protein [Allosphingosinicella sp.]